MDIKFLHADPTIEPQVDGRTADTIAPKKLRRLILRKTNNAILANMVEFIAESIDAICRKLADGSPQMTAQALNDLIDLIVETNRMLGSLCP